MTLKDYINLVLDQTPEMTEVNFDVNLYPDTTISESETGNKVKFTIFKGESK